MPFEKVWKPFSLKGKKDLSLYFEKNVFGDFWVNDLPDNIFPD
jgi:hypothetical protein